MKDWENVDGELNFDMWHSTGETIISLQVVIPIANPLKCWKPLKLKLPKRENVLDVTMGNQQGSLFFYM